MIKYIKVLRPVNLFIVLLTQFFFYFKLIYPSLLNESLEPSLNTYEVLLFMIVTIIITSCGYVINDYFDFEIDAINQKQQFGIDKKYLLKYFYCLVILGFIISSFLAYSLERIHLLGLYPASILLLYSYSKRLKLSGFIGNVVVALFCGMTTLILLLAEPQLTINTGTNIKLVVFTIWAFSIFAFCINLIREIVKDMEDLEGDLKANSNSLPIKNGINRTKILIYFNSIVLIILINIWSIVDLGISIFEIKMFNFIFLVAPLIMSMFLLKKSKTSNDFHKISILYKWIMLSGLFAMMLIANHLNN